MTSTRSRFRLATSAVQRGVLTTFLAACAALVAFGPRPEDAAGPPPEPGVTVVTYWEKWTGGESEQMQGIVDDFNRTVGRERRIHVRYVPVADVIQKTLTATAAGVPPDVAGTWDAYVPAYAALGALEPLDALAAERGVTAGQYKPVYWNGCLYRGRLYGLPSVGWVTALIYNKRAFDESAPVLRAAGLDPATAPSTLDELDRYAVALDVRDDRGRIDRAGYLPLYPGAHVAHLPFWFGGRLYDPAADRLTLTDPACVAAFASVRKYSERLGTDSLTEFRSGFGGRGSAQDPFLTGKVTMMMGQPSIAKVVETFRPEMNRRGAQPGRSAVDPSLAPAHRKRLCAWAAAPFPSVQRGQAVCFAGFDALVVPKGAKHPSAAFEFIAYVNRPEVAERLAALHCTNTCLRTRSDGFVDQHPNPYIDVFEDLAGGPGARGLPPIAIWPEVGNEMGFVAESVYLLEKTPEQALAEAQARLAGQYDTFRRIQSKRTTAGP